MDIHNMNNNKLSKVNFSGKELEKVPETINSFISDISKIQDSSQIYEVFRKYSDKNDGFTELPNGAYRYGEYFIYHGASQYFEQDINGLQVAKKLSLTAAPELISVNYLPSDRVVLVTKVSDLKNGELSDFESNKDKLSLIERLAALDSFKRMLANDFINQAAIESTENWYLKPDKTLVIDNWKHLRRVFDNKEKLDLFHRAESYLGIEKNEDDIYVIKKNN